ncbi:hypothetical protein VN12_21145 [Pirellula sp. SH-Sr6A]|nr:hypothetical protein VN12_21145 [Pirellula sp. SH-Sr6A]
MVIATLACTMRQPRNNSIRLLLFRTANVAVVLSLVRMARNASIEFPVNWRVRVWDLYTKEGMVGDLFRIA